ncbi:TetR/AcrR family transcriptional regulator [Streptomyces sp. NPDC000348]|uniref:TetR/AcrR family transcriptional regulator n=1 Tax=Streptomyces sp. NPDC000348 TaxID=3364538 RepID=UPI0036C8B0DA
MVDTPARADAARNREKILDTAKRVFAERGVDVPLDTLAKEARVGPGTLYRHFPGREALVAALVSAELDNLERSFVALRQADLDAAEKLERWSAALRGWMTSYVGLPEPLRDALSHGSGGLADKCELVIAWTEELVQAGRTAGVVNDFVTGREFYRAALGLAWVTSKVGAPDGPELDGLRCMVREGWHRASG